MAIKLLSGQPLQDDDDNDDDLTYFYPGNNMSDTLFVSGNDTNDSIDSYFSVYDGYGNCDDNKW